MLRRAGIALLFGGLLLAVLLALKFGRVDSDDPIYQGRRLSEWFQQYALADAGTLKSGEPVDWRARQPLAAMRALGTNALPWLMRQAFEFEPRGVWGTNRLVWRRADQPLPFAGQKVSLRVPRLIPRLELCQKATDAILNLRYPADVLLYFLRDPLRAKGTTRYRAALYQLGGAGDGAEKVVPHLVAALRETNDVIATSLALQSLEWIGSAGRVAIPALVEGLPTATPPWRVTRIEAMLGNYGPAAAAAVPELERLMRSDAQPAVRAQATVALCQIRGDHADALALIRRALSESHAEVPGTSGISRETLLGALSRTRGFSDNLGRALAPILAELAEDESGAYLSLSSATMVLNHLAPETAAALWRRRMRDDPDPNVRAWSADQMLRLQRTNDEAVTVLCQLVATNLPRQFAPFQSTWLLYLGEANSRSKLAIQTLERVAARSEHPTARETARSALDEIRWREVSSASSSTP